MVALSHLMNELRYPTTRRGKIIVTILAALVFSFLLLLVVGGFLLSGALVPRPSGESIDPRSFLGNVEVLDFVSPDGERHNGWFFPGLRGGPVIVLSHGYRSSRSEVLTLATSLQQHRYNVFAFNSAGHGESPVGYTTLGYKESEELLAALEMLTGRTDIDTQRMGLWGYSMGAYSSLRAAEQFPQVKAVAVDSAYQRPPLLLELELERVGLQDYAWVTGATILEYRVLSLLWSRGHPSLSEVVGNTEGLPKLFITGSDRPRLAQMTRELYRQAPGPKEIEELPRTNMASLIEEERRNYENLVVGFFLRYLPLAKS